jgi:adenylosuccinate lyase
MKNIVSLSVIAFIMLLVGALIHYGKTSPDVIFTANVEALSDAEHGEYVKCWKSIRDDISDVVLYCGTCTELPGTYRGGMNFCKP